MKRIIGILTLAACVSSCTSSCSSTRNMDPPGKNDYSVPVPGAVNCDSVYHFAESVRLTALASLDSVKNISKENESLRRQMYVQNQIMDSILIVNDTLGKRLLHARLIIENVRFYTNIAYKNPSQRKFLTGWIRRVLPEKK